jgi:two-component system, OmpR family, sensor histidine kinase BaeS
LVAVAGLALPVVWGSMVAAEAAAPVLRKSIVVLGTALTGLVGLVMASAMVRMDALIDAFGLTNLRLYPAAFMGWLALTLAWLVACVWRQRTEWFATGAVAAGLATIFCLNVANPDAVMASVNVARGPGNVDERHLCSLSADAAPVILANQEALSSQTLADARRDLDGPDDWRQWTVAMVRYRGVE